MRGDALYRVIGGIALVLFSVTVPIIKYSGSHDIAATLSADPLLPVGCLAITILGVLVSAAGVRSLKRIRMMTGLVERRVREENRIVTTDIAEAVGVHETDVRERVDEMIEKRAIPAGTRITYVGGEKVVK
jgi:hypothetical protein